MSYKFTKEHRKKLSIANKGQIPLNKGKTNIEMLKLMPIEEFGRKFLC